MAVDRSKYAYFDQDEEGASDIFCSISRLLVNNPEESLMAFTYEDPSGVTWYFFSVVTLTKAMMRNIVYGG